MWNHSSKKNPKVAERVGSLNVKKDDDDLIERVEKHLDLTNYLSFLQDLFSRSASDGESSDMEMGASLFGLDLNNPGISSNLVSPAVTAPTVKIARKKKSPPTQPQSLFNARSVPKSATTTNHGSSECSTNSSFSADDAVSAYLHSDLTPMTDIELNNLLKRTNYLGSDEVEVDPMTFELDDHDTSITDDPVKKPNKKKKRKPPKKDLHELPRQNRPNSGGKGNGHGPSHTGGSGPAGFNGSVSDTSGGSRGSSNNSSSNNNTSNNNSGGGGSQLNRDVNCARKQSLKKCASAAASKNSSSISVPSRRDGRGGAVKSSNNTAIINSTSTDTLLAKSAALSLPCLTGNNNNNGKRNFKNSSKQKNSKTSSSELHLLDLMNDSDDNDSLSDYLSMTATTNVPFHNGNGFIQTAAGEMFSDDSATESSMTSKSETGDDSGSSKGRKRKKASGKKQDASKHKKLMLQKQAKYIEVMNLKRKRIYVGISKKEVPKAQRTTVTTHKEELAVRKRLAQACARAVRQQAIQSQKTTKESVWRAKRLTREMQAFWKQADRVEKGNKKRKDKEDEEQRKQDDEVLEAKRLQQNLNFLITETELYAHLITRKLHDDENPDDNNLTNASILDRLKGESMTSQEVDSLKIKAKINVHEAIEAQKIHTKLFHIDSTPNELENVHPQDDNAPVAATPCSSSSFLFSGTLKNYQTLGVNWLSKLFDHGFNGVLADDMGLGKTVQSIAFLSQLAEKSCIWGPFLVIAPSSSLHQWQHEIKRFVADFKIVPYWGNPQERKILRQFWQQTNLHKREASFHVVVTSYNVVVQDLKYFNKVKWQYLILDEAQAIKSSVSTRWKALIGFNCRNRLLLTTGLSIQNSISELLSLLHFIMPSLFISRDDFGDWFSKQLENHADDGEDLEKKNRTRLYSVLQQFMLRRTKKDVESELCDKIELLLPCPLSSRQRFFHTALVRKIITEDILKTSSNTSSSPTSPPPNHDARNLLSLVMQFRKVCNHPDLFERRDMKSPLFMDKIVFPLPKLLFQDQLAPDFVNCSLLNEQFNIFKPSNVHCSLFRDGFNNSLIRKRGPAGKVIEDVHVANVSETLCEWSFLRFSGLGTGDIYKFVCDGNIQRMNYLVKFNQEMSTIRKQRHGLTSKSLHFEPTEFLIYTSFRDEISETVKNLVFTSCTEAFYKWNEMIPTNELKIERKHGFVILNKNGPGFDRSWDLEPLQLPKLLFNLSPKVKCIGIRPHVSDGPVNKWILSTMQCSTREESNSIVHGSPNGPCPNFFTPQIIGGLLGLGNVQGWSGIVMPDKERLVTDSGKMMVLDGLLKNLKLNGHRVVICSPQPKMMDLIEEYFRHNRKWTYFRTDCQKNHSDFRCNPDTFAILLTTMTRAGQFIGHSLSEMDTIIFYDYDWSASNDQQATDLADRIGQAGHVKQVTLYKLFCKGTIEDRIMRKMKQRNENKSLAELPSEGLTPKEILSLLIDEDEVDRKHRQRPLDRKAGDKSSDKKAASSQSGHTMGGSSTSNQTTEAHRIVNGDADHLKVTATSSGGSFQSQESSPSSAQEESDDMDSDLKDLEFDVTVYEEDLSEINPSTSDYFDNYSRWNNGSTSDYEEDLPFIPKKPKLGRGTGKRGRPPSRVRVQMRDLSGGDLSMRRGPGRPRLKPIGPLNQGIRGRRPGRPPLSKKAETISSSLSPAPRVFGIYNSQDLNMSSS